MSGCTLPDGYLKNPFLHAYLVLSSDFKMRNETAKKIAESVLCTGKAKGTSEPCGACPNCIKNAADTHPDVIYVGKGSKTGVDDIRKIEEEAYLAPNEAEEKVFVLENADEYNVQSQNALLKIIEEPPAHVRFVLTASSVVGILPTVRSRVCTITVHGIDEEELLKDIKREKQGLTSEELEYVCAFVKSYDKTNIKELDETELLKYRRLALDYFSGEEKQPAIKFPVKREELMLCLQAFMLAATEICRSKFGICEGMRFLSKEEISSCVFKTSLKKANAMYDVFENGYVMTESYANINATISYLWQSIR